MNILILRFSSIGDIVLTTPVLRCIKKKYPFAKIHYCTKPVFVSLLENNPYIDKIIPLSNSLPELIKEIKTTDYDYVFDLHHNLRTLRIKLALKSTTKIFAFNKINIKKFITVKFKKISVLPKIHIVDRYFKSLEILAVENDLEGLDYFFPENFSCDDLPAPFNSNYIVIAIGAQYKTKQLPVHKLIEICKTSSQNFVLIGGKEDFDRGEQIARACINVLNVAGKYSIDGSAYLIKNAQHIITNDTGMMHIAAAFNKKICSIWGNTIPEFGMYPYMPKNPENYSIHQVQNLKCRPCSKIGFNECPKKHFACMEQQNVAEIVEQIRQ